MVSNVWLGISITILSTFFGAGGALLFRLVSREKPSFWRLFLSIKLYLGFFCYAFAALLFVFSLRFGDLSLLYPFAALSYVWVSFFSIFFLQEKMNSYKWLGIFCILLGVFFLGWGA